MTPSILAVAITLLGGSFYLLAVMLAHRHRREAPTWRPLRMSGGLGRQRDRFGRWGYAAWCAFCACMGVAAALWLLAR